MKDCINWGIIGCGGIAKMFVSSIRAVENSNLFAVASRTPGKAKDFSGKHGIESYYSDYESLLQIDELDAVYIATTANFHFENVKLVLESGKSVLCEKPFTVNADELKELIQIACERNLFMMEGMWTRFLPAMVQLRELLDKGKIGKVKQLRATFGFQLADNINHRLLDTSLAGGALLDTGVYPLSFANMVMKEKPVKVQALADIGESSVDEQSAYLLKYASGALGILDSTISAGVVSRAEVMGTKGSIQISDKFLGADELILNRPGQEPLCMSFPYDKEASFKFEIEAASEAIRLGKLEHEIMSLSDSLQIIETMDKIRGQIDLVFQNDLKSN
ncbi:MAG: Gfo/Idh/MocA family oxidoreductase [Spirochaetales bacterium]|nr:Gfo/Idh/MocA family oxidoreductase [Spirochaetales bacterium]